MMVSFENVKQNDFVMMLVRCAFPAKSLARNCLSKQVKILIIPCHLNNFEEQPLKVLSGKTFYGHPFTLLVLK